MGKKMKLSTHPRKFGTHVTVLRPTAREKAREQERRQRKRESAQQASEKKGDGDLKKNCSASDRMRNSSGPQ